LELVNEIMHKRSLVFGQTFQLSGNQIPLTHGKHTTGFWEGRQDRSVKAFEHGRVVIVL
jgi:hypothetical protein